MLQNIQLAKATPRQQRRNYTAEQLETLQRHFLCNQSPDAELKKIIATEIGATATQISVSESFSKDVLVVYRTCDTFTFLPNAQFAHFLY